jgi:type IV secretion system protein VirB9
LQPDLKVYVAGDASLAKASPKYYSASQVTALQDELAQAKAAAGLTQVRAQEATVAFRQQYPAALQFPYGTPKYEKPFFVRSIWNDGEFTYIKSDAKELPALYEMKDGQPSLVNFQVQAGTYVVPKVIERGYLTLGKDKFSFEQGR